MKHKSWSIAATRPTPAVGDRYVRAVRAIRRTAGQNLAAGMHRMQMSSVELDNALMGTWRVCYLGIDRVKIRRINSELLRKDSPPRSFPLAFSYGYLKVLPSSLYMD